MHIKGSKIGPGWEIFQSDISPFFSLLGFKVARTSHRTRCDIVEGYLLGKCQKCSKSAFLSYFSGFFYFFFYFKFLNF